MKVFFTLATVLTVSVATSLASPPLEASSWLTSCLREKREASGHREWWIVFTTSHFGKDPLLAVAARAVAVELLNRNAANGDSVRVVSMEWKPWKITPPIALGPSAESIAAARDQFPVTPAPNSVGGSDIEAGLAALAPQTTLNPIIVVISKGASQAPSSGEGSLLGEDAPSLTEALGQKRLDLPKRHWLEIGGGRSLLLTLVLPNSFTPGPPRQVYGTSSIQPEPNVVREGRAGGRDEAGWWVLIAGVAGAVGIAAGWSLRRPKAGTPEPVTVGPDDASDNPEGEAAGWKAEAKRLQKSLDLIAQDLGDNASSLTDSLKMMTTQLGDAAALRHQILERQAELAAWDETAMDFLDGTQRALSLPGLSSERRESWQKAAQDFSRLAARNGLDVIDPRPGDRVQPGLHRIEKSEGSGDEVLTCLSWGYRRSNKVLRPALVEVGSLSFAGEKNA